MDTPFRIKALVDTLDPVDVAAFGELPTMEELEQRRQKYIEDMDKPVHTPWGTWHKFASTLQQETLKSHNGETSK